MIDPIAVSLAPSILSGLLKYSLNLLLDKENVVIEKYMYESELRTRYGIINDRYLTSKVEIFNRGRNNAYIENIVLIIDDMFSNKKCFRAEEVHVIDLIGRKEIKAGEKKIYYFDRFPLYIEKTFQDNYNSCRSYITVRTTRRQFSKMLSINMIKGIIKREEKCLANEKIGKIFRMG